MFRGKHRSASRMRRTTILVALPAAVVLLSLAASSVASGAPSKSSAKFKVVSGAATLGSTYRVAKSNSGRIAQTDPSLLGRTDEPRPRDHQVRLRRRCLVHGRPAGPGGDEPECYGQDAEGERGRGVRPTTRIRRTFEADTAAARRPLRACEVVQPSRRHTAASRARCPRIRSARCSRRRASPPCRRTR